MALPFLSIREDEKPFDGPILRVAIMGLGSYGTRVADAMKDCKKAKLVGVISGTPSKITDWQSKYGIPAKNCYNYENFDKIRDNPDIDAVYVITPNALHHDQVIRVAEAGKHVISEKPMAVNAREAQEMVDACKKANVKLLVGYRMHFEPKTVAVINMRKSGEFGKILFFQGLSGFIIGDPNQWRLNKSLSGGGAMMDIGIYSVNGSRYMVGEEPVWVTAQETKTDKVKFAEGVDFSENGQAMDAIREVGPGAHYLGCNHTQKNFESAFWRSGLADNNSFEQWQDEGSNDIVVRANTKWKQLLRDYAQREVGHKVLLATLAAGVITWYMTNPALAVASMGLFALPALMSRSMHTAVTSDQLPDLTVFIPGAV